MSKENKKSKLEIEKSIDGLDQDSEAHIIPLLEQISKLQLGNIDLTSKETAASAIPMLNDMIEKLNTFRNVSRTLRSFSEDKKTKN